MRPDRKPKIVFLNVLKYFITTKKKYFHIGLVSPQDSEYKYNQKAYENAALLCIYKKQERPVPN